MSGRLIPFLPQSSIPFLRQAVIRCHGFEFDVILYVRLVIICVIDFCGMSQVDTKYSKLLEGKLSEGEKFPIVRGYLQKDISKKLKWIFDINKKKSKERTL